MKHMKKLVALALVVLSVMAIAIPAMTAVWSDRYSDITLYKNTPGDVNGYIMHVQSES